MNKMIYGSAIAVALSTSPHVMACCDYWTMSYNPGFHELYGSTKFGTPQAACDAWFDYAVGNSWTAVEPRLITEDRGECWATGFLESTGEPIAAGFGHLSGYMFPVCEPPTVYNETTEQCEVDCPLDKPWDGSNRQCIPPTEPDDCSNQAGNPINFFSGHKLQRETVFQANGVFPLTFSWLYNSFGNHHKGEAGYVPMTDASQVSVQTMRHTEKPLKDGAQRIKLPLGEDSTIFYIGGVINHWRHNHSYFLSYYNMPENIGARVVLYRPDGRNLYFTGGGGSYSSQDNPSWLLTLERDESGDHERWTLRTDGRIEYYDEVGRILRVESQQGVGISYEYDEETSQQKKIVHDHGHSIELSYDGGKLTQVTRDDGSVYRFSYGHGGLLASIVFGESDGEARIFHYEDPRFPRALTGVTSESGVRYSTFTYDDQGRAVSSEHSQGVDALYVDYVSDNIRTLTNALGKKTTYRYKEVGGVKRIGTIEGEASANCAAANKNYSYDSNGFVSSQTDWSGSRTTYVRDTRGRELSRTESTGTPEARTTTTEWHPTLNLKTKIVTDEQTTVMTYDDAGRLTSKTVQTTNPQ